MRSYRVLVFLLIVVIAIVIAAFVITVCHDDGDPDATPYSGTAATAMEQSFPDLAPTTPLPRIDALGTFLAGRAAGQVMLVWGYADGARAAVWAGGLAPGYAPELDLRGIAAGAVVTDPGQLLRLVDTSRARP
ncbi:lipase family protein [Nocardia gipuzkoensis]